MKLEEAKKIISKVSTRYNMVTEYKDVFLFWVAEGDELIGGNEAPKGVMKKTGEIKSMPQLILDGVIDDNEISEQAIELAA